MFRELNEFIPRGSVPDMAAGLPGELDFTNPFINPSVTRSGLQPRAGCPHPILAS